MPLNKPSDKVLTRSDTTLDALAPALWPNRQGNTWQRLTRHLGGHSRSKLLVVSYAFPPFLDTAGIVAAKRLALRGEGFDLITHNLLPRAQTDQRLAELLAPLVGQQVTVAGPPRTHREKSLATWCKTGLAAVRPGV
ncbi:MAG: hypothetical protein LBG70_00355, partial [Bifidobacteriaceae bacterium]|nr:hypothetical protein [Bifidobacteriaceae bacterium]